jgi:hypothetical protein
MQKDSEVSPKLQQYIDESIENSVSTVLSLSALHLSTPDFVLENSSSELEYELNCIEEEASFKELKSSISAYLKIPPKRHVKPKVKSASSSLFDMFASSSSQLAPRLNIRDVLDSSESKILEQCYNANVDELVLGFNTTESEVSELTSKLFENLVLECSTCEKYGELSMSFLDLHLKWIEVCVNEEECHPFAFMLLRNVTSGLQHVKFPSAKIYMVSCMMKMLVQYMKLCNDGSSFQTLWMQIFYLIIHIFFNNHETASGMHAVFAYFDTNGSLFSRCISCISSPLLLQRCITKTNLIQSLMDMLSSDSSFDNEMITKLKEMDKERNFDSMVAEHLLSLMREVTLNLSSQTIYQLIPDQNIMKEVGTVKILSFDDIKTFVSSLERVTVVKNEDYCISRSKCHSKNVILYLLQPFYHMLEIGTSMDSSHLFGPLIRDICADAIAHIILTGCSRDNGLLEKVMSFLLVLFEKMNGPSNTNFPHYTMIEKDNRTGLVSLSPAVQALFQIYKRVLMDLPWEEYALLDDWENFCNSFLRKHFGSILTCIHNLLSAAKSQGAINISSWNDSITVLLPMIRIEKLKGFSIIDEENIVSLVTDYQGQVTKRNESLEAMMLIHCILFSVKGNKIADDNERAFATNVTLHCWSMFLSGHRSYSGGVIIDFDSLMNFKGSFEVDVHRETLPLVRSYLKEFTTCKILMHQINEMLNS